MLLKITRSICFALAKKPNAIKNIVLAIMLVLNVISNVLAKNVKTVVTKKIKWISKSMKVKDMKTIKIYKCLKE